VISVKKPLSRLAPAAIILAAFLSLIPAGSASAATSSADIREAQTIIAKFGIPVGPVDGLNGPNTAQGMCAFRWLAGLPVSRAVLDTATLAKLREYNSRYANSGALPKKQLSNGVQTYMVAEQTCQTMFYFYQGSLWSTFSISSGRPGQETPNGYYGLSAAQRGWSCSTLFPTTCHTQTNGKNIGTSNYGNMYNKRAFIRSQGFYVHGSNSVPTKPDSAGCIRMYVPDMDWVSDNVAAGTPLLVTGKYY
jgi:lipoprotein-anchoring transpeptidase ErfK/SrfK